MLDDVAALGAEFVEPLQQRLPRFRVELLEGEVLKLLADFLNAHAAGKRRIDVHRLLRDALALFGRLDEMQRPHVVQAVGELHQQHANVVRHGQQELAEILGLLGTFRCQLDARQLGDAVDQIGDLDAEEIGKLVDRRASVLDGVVKDRGDDGRRVELQVGQNARDFDGMREIGIAARPHLTAMLLHGVDIGAVDQGLVRTRIVA